MSHQVFISHSSRNADIASAMKSYLEGRGIRCWKAPEDIPFGTDWDVGIMNGLSSCRAMVLIFSKEADDSRHVKREVEIADSERKVILPFRIDEAMPSNLKYFLSLPQWLDGIAGIEEAFADLYIRLSNVLSIPGGGGELKPQQPPKLGQAIELDQAVSQADMDQLMSVLPEYQDWATNSDLRERLRWSKEKLKSAANQLEKKDLVIFRDGNGGAIALKTQELAALEANLLNGSEPYPYFVNVGEGSNRHWDDNHRYNFFCAGGGKRFANLMQAIPPGSEVYLYLSQHGYVAKARTLAAAVPIDRFLVNGTPIAQLPLIAPDAKSHILDHIMCEWLIGVEWDKALNRNYAVRKKGLFVHVATSCRIKDPITIKYLREAFAVH